MGDVDCVRMITWTVTVMTGTAILIIIEGQLQFSSSKLVLKTVENGYVALNYYENGSSGHGHVRWQELQMV